MMTESGRDAQQTSGGELFVLSTGRSGSKTIAQTVDTLPGWYGVHEPEPKLVPEAHAYLTGQMDSAELVSLLQRTRRSPDRALRYAESNQKLSFMIAPLVEAFPNASFLWMVRNGLDAVASWENLLAYRGEKHGVARRNSEWTKYRLCGDEVGDVPAGQWKRMSPFARNCWYWNYTNRKIQEDLTRLGARWMMIRLEDLPQQVPELCRFLDAPQPADLRVPVANRAVRKVSKAQYWDHRQRKEFESICGELMDELYPGWPNRMRYPAGTKLRNEALALLSYRTRTGRLLRTVAGWIPQPALRPIRRRLEGRGVLNYPDR
ncbi:MAG: hypothetical protein ACOC93_00870 [Planctomycetota bacterium]